MLSAATLAPKNPTKAYICVCVCMCVYACLCVCVYMRGTMPAAGGGDAEGSIRYIYEYIYIYICTHTRNQARPQETFVCTFVSIRGTVVLSEPYVLNTYSRIPVAQPHEYE